MIGNVNDGMKTRSSLKQLIHEDLIALFSQLEPKDVKEALNDEFWVQAMHEELHQFERNDVWSLVPRPDNHPIIGTK